MRLWWALLVAWLVAVAAFRLLGSDERVSDSESAYRLRLAELTLATGSVPEVDRFRSPDDPVPWSPWVHGGTALLLRRIVPEAGKLAARGQVDERELETRARRLWRGVAGVMSIAAVIAGLVSALPRRRLATVGVTLVVLLSLPPWAPYTWEASLPPGVWIGLWGFALCVCVGWRERVRTAADLGIVQLLAGVLAGMLLQTAVSTWPIVVAAAVFLVQARGVIRRADEWRTWTLFWVGLAAVLTVPGRALDPHLALPSFALGWQGMLTSSARTWAYLVGFPVAWWLCARLPRAPGRFFGLVTGGLCFVLGLLDKRFEPLFGVFLVGTVVAALVGAWEHRRRRTLAVGGALLTCALLAGTVAGTLAARSGRDPTAEARAYLDGLKWLRANTPSPAPWNHPQARPRWTVLCNPLEAGNVLYHARRPVAAAALPGFRWGAVEQECTRLLLEADEGPAFVAQLLAGGMPYVVVAARDLRHRVQLQHLIGGEWDAERWQSTALVRLVSAPRSAAADHFSGLERVYVSAKNAGLSEKRVPAVSVYRVADSPAALEGR